MRIFCASLAYRALSEVLVAAICEVKTPGKTKTSHIDLHIEVLIRLVLRDVLVRSMYSTPFVVS